MRHAVTAVLLSSLFALPAFAQDASPVGLWKTFDDGTGKAKSLVRITESGGALVGRVEKIFIAPGQDQNPICIKCTGEKKDKQVLGMVIMWSLKKDGDEYTGGEILDPDNGKVYRSKLAVLDGGRKITVRGYIGMPLLGRSQVWTREE
jgi:uncharacterized protein (DUF2147 family)